MVLPQRGHMEPLEAQVVPQLEQVDTRQHALELAFAGGQLTLPPPAAAATEPLE